MDGPIIGGARFDGTRRPALGAMAREDVDRHTRRSRTQARERRERVRLASPLHELDDEQHREIGTHLLSGQIFES